MSWKAVSSNLLFLATFRFLQLTLTSIKIPMSKVKLYEFIQSTNSIKSLPKDIKLERGSPFTGLLIVYCCLVLVAEDRQALWLVLLLGLSNFVLLLWRMNSIGVYEGRYVPSLKDIRSYLYLIVVAFPLRAVCLVLSFVVSLILQKVVLALSLDHLSGPWLSWVLSLWSTKGFPLTSELIVHVICARLLLLVWDVTCTETFSKKRRYTYGSHWAALLLPTVNGMSYICVMFFHWTAVVRFVAFVFPTIFPVVSGTIFYVVHQIFSSLLFDPGFFRIHSIYHSPEYFGVVHLNHHLANYPDWVDGLGEGPEEALLTFPTFQSWLPPAFCPIGVWVFVASVSDGSVHAYEPPVMTGEVGCNEETVGYYNNNVLMHVHHHLSITLNLSTPACSDLYEEEKKRNKLLAEGIANMSLTEEALRKMWFKKMGFLYQTP